MAPEQAGAGHGIRHDPGENSPKEISRLCGDCRQDDCLFCNCTTCRDGRCTECSSKMHPSQAGQPTAQIRVEDSIERKKQKLNDASSKTNKAVETGDRAAERDNKKQQKNAEQARRNTALASAKGKELFEKAQSQSDASSTITKG